MRSHRIPSHPKLTGMPFSPLALMRAWHFFAARTTVARSTRTDASHSVGNRLPCPGRLPSSGRIVMVVSPIDRVARATTSLPFSMMPIPMGPSRAIETVAELARHGFQGPTYTVFQNRLCEENWKPLQSMLGDGSLAKLTTQYYAGAGIEFFVKPNRGGPAAQQRRCPSRAPRGRIRQGSPGLPPPGADGRRLEPRTPWSRGAEGPSTGGVCFGAARVR